MKREPSAMLERETANWIAEGPTSAPSDLLARTMARTRSARRRPALVARVLGAPSAGGATRGTLPVAAWIAIALALASASIVVIAGMGERRDPLVVAPASTASIALRTGDPVRPTSTPTPTVTFQTFDTELGFSVTLEGTDPWVKIDRGRWDGHAVEDSFDFGFGDCSNGLCRDVVTIAVDDLDDGLIVDWEIDPGASCPPEYAANFMACSTWKAVNQATGSAGKRDLPLRIKARSTAALAAEWATFSGGTPIILGGDSTDWVTGRRSGRTLAMTVHGSKLIAIVWQSPNPGASSDEDDLLHRFIAGVRFDPPPSPTD